MLLTFKQPRKALLEDFVAIAMDDFSVGHDDAIEILLQNRFYRGSKSLFVLHHQAKQSAASWFFIGLIEFPEELIHKFLDVHHIENKVGYNQSFGWVMTKDDLVMGDSLDKSRGQEALPLCWQGSNR